MKNKIIINTVDEIKGIISSKEPEGKPFVIAIDGYSASGKSTLSKELLSLFPEKAAIIEGDDFYRVMSNAERLKLSPEQGVDMFFDWQRLSQVLDRLQVGLTVNYQAYSWSKNCLGEVKEVFVPDILFLEGVYSSRPELKQFIDYHILVETSYAQRYQRQLDRGENSSDLIEKWASSEEFYFKRIYNQNPNIIISGN